MKNEEKKSNIDNKKINQKIKDFLSIISNKKDFLKIFRKRHINYINKTSEKKESITIKITSLNNLIKEFEKLVQSSLELILFFQDAFNQCSNIKAKEEKNEDLINEDIFYNSKYYTSNISNLNITDKLKYKKYSKKYNNKTVSDFNTELIENNKTKNSDILHNFRNYNSVKSLIRNNHINGNINRNEHISYNYENITPSLKERTLRTLYKGQYSQKENNNHYLNIQESMINNKESKFKIPIRNVLRALIKNNKVYNNNNNNFNEKNNINENELFD